jgi:hypothetical protein
MFIQDLGSRIGFLSRIRIHGFKKSTGSRIRSTVCSQNYYLNTELLVRRGGVEVGVDIVGRQLHVIVIGRRLGGQFPDLGPPVGVVPAALLVHLFLQAHLGNTELGYCLGV